MEEKDHKSRPLVRHEYKAIINEGQYHCLKAGISALMTPDSHMGEKGYFIRSLYFDDSANHGYYDKVEGLYKRQKLRLRIYDFTSGVIKLEVKGKRGDRVLKHTFSVERDAAEGMIQGIWPDEIKSKLLEEGLFVDAFSPKVVIDYFREAYTYPYQKIRLTFDREIASSSETHHFFQEDMGVVPLLNQGQMVFEIKYEEMLPDYLVQFISTAGIIISGYSKYVNGRAVVKA